MTPDQKLDELIDFLDDNALEGNFLAIDHFLAHLPLETITEGAYLLVCINYICFITRREPSGTLPAGRESYDRIRARMVEVCGEERTLKLLEHRPYPTYG